MSDDVKHQDAEPTLDSLTDDVSIDAGKDTIDSLGGEPSTTLTEQEKAQRREEARAGQAKAWAKKVLTNEVSLDSLPADVAWLKGDIEAEIGSVKAASTPKPTLSPAEQLRFEMLKEKVRTELTYQEEADLTRKARELMQDGISSPLKATSRAVELLGLQTKLEPKRRAPEPVKSGAGAPPAEKTLADYTATELNKLPMSELVKLK